MALDETSRETIDAFREYIEGAVAGDERYGDLVRADREDESTLASRFRVGACWLELAVRPFVPQVRVGVLTDDRWKSEEIEQGIQDSGDTMEEFVELGFSEAGLDWSEPIVEHYREGGKYFYFATPLDIEEIPDLAWEEPRNKVLRMLEGYLVAFGPFLEGDEEDTAEEDEDDEED
jgi:hypothetical protein